MSDFSAGYIMSMVMFVMVGAFACLALNLRADAGHDAKCKVACAHRVMPRDERICSCLDGRVFAWQQGYTHQLGKR